MATPPEDLVPLPADTSQGGSGNGARGDVARKMKEVEHLFANLEREGAEINGRITSIIDDEIARIKAEAARKKNKGPIGNVVLALLTISSAAFGFYMGVDWYERALLQAVLKKILFG